MNTLAIGIKVDPGDSASRADAVTSALHKAEDQGARTKHSFDALGETFAKIGKNQLHEQIEKSSTALSREQKMLEQMHKPMQDYQRDLETLTSLRQKDLISAREHADQLDSLRSRAGITNPAAAVSLPAAPAGGGMLDSLKDLAAPAAAVGGLALSIIHLSDAYTELENKARKFTDSTHTANQIIQEQLSLAGDLHASLSETIDVYDAVRDGTDGLNLSHEKQIALTRTLGEAVQLSGRSLGEAGGLMERFSAAMAGGVNDSAALRKMMVQMPDLADLWTKSFNTTRAGFLKLVADHKIGMQQVIDVTIQGASVHEEFAKRTETVEQRWQHLKDEFIAGLHPFRATIDALEEMQRAAAQGGYEVMSFTNGMKAGRADVENFTASLEGTRQKMAELQVAGIALGPMAGTQKLLTEGMKAGAFLHSLDTPMERYTDQVKQLDTWLAKGTINATDYARAIQRLQAAMPHAAQGPQGMQGEFPWSTVPDAVSGGQTPQSVEAQLAALKSAGRSALGALGRAGQEVANADSHVKLMDAEQIIAAAQANRKWNEELQESEIHTSIIEAQLKGAATSLADTLVDAANGADVSWSKFFGDMFKNFEKAILQAELLEIVGSAHGGNMGAGSGLLGALFGGAHAFGGSYTAPSSGGGQDSVTAMFRLSPGERVDFTPPGRKAESGGQAASTPVQVHNIIVDQRDPRALYADPGFKNAITTVILENRGAIKRLIG